MYYARKLFMLIFIGVGIMTWTNRVIPKELLAENLGYLSTVCRVSLKQIKETGQTDGKRSGRARNYLQQTNSS